MAAIDLCQLSKGIKKECGKMYPSGVKAMAFANWSANKFVTTASGIVSASDFSGWGVQFFPVDVARETAVATANVQQGANPDCKSIQHTVTGHINGQITDTTGAAIIGDDLLPFIMADLVIAVLRNDGSIKFYGTTNGLSSVQFDESTGTSATDANGWDFSYQGTQATYPLIAASGTGGLDWETIIAVPTA